MTDRTAFKTLTISLFVGDFDDDFEAASAAVETARDDVVSTVRSVLGDLADEVSVGKAEFVEWDSSNPDTAAAYFHVTVTGPQSLLDRLEVL